MGEIEWIKQACTFGRTVGQSAESVLCPIVLPRLMREHFGKRQVGMYL